MVGKRESIPAICVVPRFALVPLIQNEDTILHKDETKCSVNLNNEHLGRELDTRRNAVACTELKKDVTELKDVVLRRLLDKYSCM